MSLFFDGLPVHDSSPENSRPLTAGFQRVAGMVTHIFRILRTIALLWALVLAQQVGACADPEESAWERQMVAGKRAIEAADYPEAQRNYEAAAAMCGASVYRLGMSLGQLGATLMALGRQAEATRTMRRSIALLQGQTQPAPRELSVVWQGLGSSLYYQRRYADAERAYKEALKLTAGIGPPGEVAHLLANLGSVYEAERRYGAAREALDRAREAVDPATREGRFLLVALLNDFGVLYRAEGRHGDAEGTFQEAVDSLNGIEDPDGLLTVTILDNLAAEQIRDSRYEAAEGALGSALERMEGAKAVPVADRVQVLRNYRQCLQKTGRRSEIKPLDVIIKQLLATEGPVTVDVSQLWRQR